MLNHDLQVTITLSLLGVAAVLALVTDYLRIRALRREAESTPEASATHALATYVLVPELPAPMVPKSRASRLAAALKQPKRQISPAAQEAIQRGAQLATPSKGPAKQTAQQSLQRVG
jgi:hypothetical protein